MQEADKTKLAVIVACLWAALVWGGAAPAWGQGAGFGPDPDSGHRAGPGIDDVLAALPAALARVGAAAACHEEGRRDPLDVMDPRYFASFVCEAPRADVDRAIAARPGLALDLLMACDGCNVAALRRLLDLYREDSAHPGPEDAPTAGSWRAVAPMDAHRTRYYGSSSAAPDCLAYRHEYVGGGHSVAFLGISHAVDVERTRGPEARDRLFARMVREFDSERPGAIVVEGRTGRPSCGEMMHYFFSSEPPREEVESSMIYGARHGVEIIGGEPPYSGFVPPDGVGLQIVVAMGRGMPFDVAFASVAHRYPPEQLASFDSFEEFTAWYRRINGREFAAGEAAYNDTTPAEFLPPEMVRPTNRLISAMTLARNDRLLATIRGALSRHERVVTVYGSGHMPATGPALEEHVGAIDPAASRCSLR